MFLAAGLLPDPDVPFSPSLSHSHAWIAGSFMEGLQLAMFWYQESPASVLSRVEHLQLGLVMVRLVLFVAMVAFYLQPMYAWSRIQLAEAEPLLGEVDSKPVRDAQHGGWLDYVVGFSTLFPFLWSVVFVVSMGC